jgi:hypothetical protein
MPWVTVAVTITVAIIIVTVLRPFSGRPLMTHPSSTTSPITTTTVEFTYTPANFLESPITQSRSDYDLEVSEGSAKATLAAVQDPVPDELIAAIRAHVDSILGARQLLTHQPYELDERPRTAQIKSDGNRNVSLHMGVNTLIVEGYAPDRVVKDATGNVIQDTRAERIVEHQAFITRFSEAAMKDPLVGELRKSYTAAVNDPSNELIHLYEIREALKKRYGNDERAARQGLGMTTAEWKVLGRLGDAVPIKQSRHRGAYVGALRPATQEELRDARAAARRLIEAFLRTL